MDVRRGMTEIRKLKEEGYSPTMLAIMISEIMVKFNKNGKLTQTERLIVGLRYSEFLAIEDTPLAYEQAELKRQEYLKQLNLTPKDINEICRKVGNLS